MRILRIIPDLKVPDIESAKDFYTGFLDLTDEGLGLSWVARFGSTEGDARVQLVTRDETAPEDPAISVLTPDIDEAYAEAQRRGYEIVVPLRTESWGVHRFFVRAPDGTVVNVVEHDS